MKIFLYRFGFMEYCIVAENTKSCKSTELMKSSVQHYIDKLMKLTQINVLGMR